MYAVEGVVANGKPKQTMWLLDAHGQKCEPYTSQYLHLESIRTKRGNTIATMHIECPGAVTAVIFSHGNATDIGAMRDRFLDFSQQLKVHVFAYDYSGYGQSSGRASPANTFADVDAAFLHLMKRYKPQFVIAYGQSLGSGPSIYLGKKYPSQVSGVVIHSGLMSGLRVLQNIEKTKWFDIYPNVDNMRHTLAPIMIIHGTDDRDVPVHHGIKLHEAAPNPYKPWFVEGGGHNNIEVHWRGEFYARVSEFFRDVEQRRVAPMAVPKEKSKSKEEQMQDVASAEAAQV